MAHSIPLSPPIGLVRLPSLARPAHLNAHCTTDANMRTHLSSPTSRRSYCPRLTIAPPLPPAWKEGFTTRVSHSLSLHFPSSLSLLLNWPNILPQILPGPLKATGFDTASSPLSSPPPRPLPLYKPLPQPSLPFPPLTIHTRLETSSRRRSLSLSAAAVAELRPSFAVVRTSFRLGATNSGFVASPPTSIAPSPHPRTVGTPFSPSSHQLFRRHHRFG